MMKGFVFDLDNTLFDRYGTITEIVMCNFDSMRPFINIAYNAERCARHLCVADMTDNAVGGWKGVYEKLLSEHFFNSDNTPDYKTCETFMFDNFKKTAVNFPFTVPVLRALRAKGYKLALITNGYSWLQRKKLGLLGIVPEFDETVVSGEYAELMCGDENNRDYWKPQSSVFLHMAKLLNAEPGELYFVGDSPLFDVCASENAGYVPVWIRSHSPWTLENSRIPKLCFDTIEGLLTLI